MAGKREENPAGSSNNLRGDVLRVLGVVKVATVEQIQQIAAPHLSYRHTDKPTPSKRKQARTASHTGALSDLRKHGLAENGGQIPGGDRLRNGTFPTSYARPRSYHTAWSSTASSSCGRRDGSPSRRCSTAPPPAPARWTS
ncbi:hypothetical protein [Streptomyces sp. NPDC003036]|uniref:hypothetical protein n=1 Tax=Streptomyces sp. NPDC003036 TaxID=3154442 RepID=UPI0033B6C29E